jgi:hypothetical protein
MRPDERNRRAVRRAFWDELLFIAQVGAVMLIVAGVLIVFFGG